MVPLLAERHQELGEGSKESDQIGTQPEREELWGEIERTQSVPTGSENLARGDVNETFKILNGFEDIDASELFTLSDAITRGHMKKIYKKRLMKGLSLRKFFFSQRVVDNLNNLPEYVISAKTVNQFKNNFDNYLKECGYGVLKGISLY